MNNTTLPAILSVLLIVGGSWLISLFTCGGGSGDSEATKFSLLDGSLKTDAADPFTFNISGTKPSIPKSAAAVLQKGADYLNENDNRTLNLVGKYYASEKSKGDTDLGLARAEKIRDQLVKMGASEDRITTSSFRIGSTYSGEKIYKHVDFNWMEKKTDELGDVDLESVSTTFVPLEAYTLRFQTSKSDLEMTTDLRNWLDDALTHISSNPGTQFMITGYTDNQGSSRSNKDLSRNRARTVRTFLMLNGINRSQISISGKGEANPVDDNSTDEGRAMNRRVEILVK